MAKTNKPKGAKKSPKSTKKSVGIQGIKESVKQVLGIGKKPKKDGKEALSIYGKRRKKVGKDFFSETSRVSLSEYEKTGDEEANKEEGSSLISSIRDKVKSAPKRNKGKQVDVDSEIVDSYDVKVPDCIKDKKGLDAFKIYCSQDSHAFDAASRIMMLIDLLRDFSSYDEEETIINRFGLNEEDLRQVLLEIFEDMSDEDMEDINGYISNESRVPMRIVFEDLLDLNEESEPEEVFIRTEEFKSVVRKYKTLHNYNKLAMAGSATGLRRKKSLSLVDLRKQITGIPASRPKDILFSKKFTKEFWSILESPSKSKPSNCGL